MSTDDDKRRALAWSGTTAHRGQSRAAALDGFMAGLAEGRGDLEQLESRVGSLFDAIAHGDDQHRAWLRNPTAARPVGALLPPTGGPSPEDRSPVEYELDANQQIIRRVRTACAHACRCPDPSRFAFWCRQCRGHLCCHSGCPSGEVQVL